MQHTFALITLADASSRVLVAPERGGIVTSFTVGERELLYMDDATLADSTKNVRGGIPILFPFPGKLAADAWSRDGLTGGMAQHGFARQRPWTVESQKARNQVSLSLASTSATLSQYPWPFHATLTYTLNGASLRSTLRVQNVGDTTLPYALGFHPYFNVQDKRLLTIGTLAKLAYNNVAKRVESFTGFDFGAPEVDVHLLDHNSDLAVMSLDDSSHIVMRASNDFGVWVVWSLGGKDFICLEPWTSPGNALNTGERLICLTPGAAHESWMEITYANTVAA